MALLLGPKRRAPRRGQQSPWEGPRGPQNRPMGGHQNKGGTRRLQDGPRWPHFRGRPEAP
eukprot:7350701-Pyramimonas_sp.AAC.1